MLSVPHGITNLTSVDQGGSGEALGVWERIGRADDIGDLEGCAIAPHYDENGLEFVIHGGRPRKIYSRMARSSKTPGTTSACLRVLRPTRAGPSLQAEHAPLTLQTLYDPDLPKDSGVDGDGREPPSGEEAAARGPALMDHVLFTRGPLVFLHGGRDNDGVVQHRLHAYHRTRRCWIPMGPERFGGIAPPRLCGHAVAALDRKGSGFLLAGVEQQATAVPRSSGRKRPRGVEPAPCLSVFLLDFQAVRWSLVPTSGAGPSPRSHFSLCCHSPAAEEEPAGLKGAMLLAGGVRGATPVPDVWLLQLRTGVWREILVGAALGVGSASGWALRTLYPNVAANGALYVMGFHRSRGSGEGGAMRLLAVRSDPREDPEKEKHTSVSFSAISGTRGGGRGGLTPTSPQRAADQSKDLQVVQMPRMRAATGPLVCASEHDKAAPSGPYWCLMRNGTVYYTTGGPMSGVAVGC